MSAAPSTYELKKICSIGVNALQGTGAITLWTETAYSHYKIISWHAQPTGYDNEIIAGSHVLNLQIGGTTVKTTGGTNPTTLTVAAANVDAAADMGTPIDGLVIVSANEVHVGNTLAVLTTTGTGFTEDTEAGFDIYAVIERLPGK